MARIALSIAGGIIGSLIPGLGTAVGFALGSAIGGIIGCLCFPWTGTTRLRTSRNRYADFRFRVS